jgi:hypothetical protein
MEVGQGHGPPILLQGRFTRPVGVGFRAPSAVETHNDHVALPAAVLY